MRLSVLSSGEFDFFVAALPRSGTMWASSVLSFGYESLCLHEPELIEGSLDHIERIKGAFDLSLGASSPTLSLEYPPEGRPVVIIERDPWDCWESLKRWTNIPTKEMFARGVKIFSEMPRKDALVVQYQDLTKWETYCKMVKHCTGYNPASSYAHFLHWQEKARMRITTMDTATNNIQPVKRSWEPLG